MLDTDLEILRQLIDNLSAGTEQYRRAIELSRIPKHQAMFRCMVKSRQGAAAYLQPYLRVAPQETAPTHAFGSTLHKLYPEILADRDERFDSRLIEELLGLEEQTLLLMQQAVHGLQSALLRSVVLDLHPKLSCCERPYPQYEHAC